MVRREIAAVIPALNESASIAAVISGVKEYAFPIVVSDGSTDATAAIARGAGATVIEHPRNLGYERALSTGFVTAREMGFRCVVTVDADGQHHPHTMAEFVRCLGEGATVVVGKRDCRQRIGETLFSWFGRWLWGIRDPLCGMKGFDLSAIAGAEGRYPFDSAGTKYAIHAVRNGAKAAEVEVPTRPREGQSRFGSGLSTDIRLIKMIFLMAIGSRGDGG